MDRKRIILAICDYGTTGISESIRPVLKHWHDAGHEVWQLALGFNGWQSGVDKTMYPWHERLLPIFGQGTNTDRFGQTVIANALRVSKAEIVISAFDVWMVNYLAQPERAGLTPENYAAVAHDTRQFTHIAYFPLDGAVQGKHLPLGMDEAIAGFDIPVTYSRFAKQVIARDTNLDVPFIPIAHDPAHYYPGSMKEAREKLNLPLDGFIVGMVATNQYRKAWGEFFEAAIRLAKNHSDVIILPWTSWNDKIAGGAEINDFVWRSGVLKQIMDPAPSLGRLSDEGMGNLYRAMNLLVLTTIGEGAGLPPIRARACGTPALVSANTSNVEFIADPIEAIPCNGRYYDPLGSNLERYTTDVDELYERMESLYKSDLLRRQIGKIGSGAMKQYEIANVMPMWDEILEGVK